MKSTKPTPDRFLNFAELSQLIGLPVKTIQNGRCGTNTIPRVKLGSRVLFSFNAVQSWMAEQVRKTEERRLRSEIAVVDLLSEKRRRQRAIEKTIKTIANGGKYK